MPLCSHTTQSVTTLRMEDLKVRFCDALMQEGHIVLADDDEMEHLSRGIEKGIPIEAFVNALKEATSNM